MVERILLDAGPLGAVTHPRARISEPLQRWVRDQLAAGREVLIPEIADYEVRRELLRAGRSVAELNRLRGVLRYLPLDTQTMERAAELWAEARSAGQPTAAPEALDADVILAAQAERAEGVVATENPGHLGRFVTAKHWREIE